MKLEGHDEEKNHDNIFVVDEIFISFFSVKGCTLNISAAFPAENATIAAKREKPRCNLTNKEIRAEFGKIIKNQIEELGSNRNNIRAYN